MNRRPSFLLSPARRPARLQAAESAAQMAARSGRSTGLSAASFELDPSATVGPLALGPDPNHNQPLALLDALLQVGGASCMRSGAGRTSGLSCRARDGNGFKITKHETQHKLNANSTCSFG